ncbi:RTA1 like protein-domain-containing protein [Clohesyomyces aquaticus]|uniref:RTA1 like protein-domain-containing protein n=1 Tax=Clohesyomyces aquaticus TaxID=1231657 RepID=A0A1Y1YB23_9PLEO|nr:RTA1 like protein-domain-containing protein [Clohesyomyces aquaticus]
MSATLNLPTSARELLARATLACVSVTPDKNGHVPPGACDAYYAYYPSFTIAAIFTGLFLGVTVAHIYEAFHHRKSFCTVIVMGALWEFASFALRTLGTKQQQNKTIAIVSFVLFTLAPLWINAFVYMVAGRLTFCFLPSRRVFGVQAIWIAKIFVLCDILSFIVQAGGALMISPGASETLKNTGLHIYQAGIGAQQAFILLFFSILIGFHKKMSDMEKTGWRDSHRRAWKPMIWVLYLVLALITVRIVYRLAEYLIGLDDSNPLPNHEVYMYTLDAVPMLLALLVLIIVHPGRVLVGPGSNYRVEKKQLKAEKKAARKGRKQGKKDSGSNGDDEEEEEWLGLQTMPESSSNPAIYTPLSDGHGAEQGTNRRYYEINRVRI